MNSIISRRGLLEDLKESKAARDILRRIYAKTHIAAQIAANRKSRKWSQGKLGYMLSGSDKNQQPMIARYENPEYGKMGLTTLFELADAFDVVFWGEFISFDEFARRITNSEPQSLTVPSFDETKKDMEKWASSSVTIPSDQGAPTFSTSQNPTPTKRVVDPYEWRKTPASSQDFLGRKPPTPEETHYEGEKRLYG